MKKLLPVAGLFLLLIVIRMYEEVLFYDPLIDFFKSEYATKALPAFDLLKLLGFTVLRFLLNTLISLLIIWVLFQKKEIIKLSGVLYLVLFVVLMLAFYVSLQISEAGNYMLLFYIRRFLIQPLFLLILVPAFYFQLKK
ncbi:exosortase F system-associated protein [Jejudonia soesokkakensis]|uniref:Exosortase F system-associated protein n=1 Tax=Jejudonia soesokkakensis TaxID=1323432 RepID=A0ABW2MSH9_9FLAO